MTTDSDDLEPSISKKVPLIGKIRAETTVEDARPPVDQPSLDDISLLILSGPGAGRYFKVPNDGGVIGRDPDVEICVPDPGVSREHAELIRTSSEQFEIVDLESRYGVFVESEQVTCHALSDGDRVQLSGETVMRVRYQDERETDLLARMQETLTRDALTTVFNRRYFLERLEQEYAYARRHRAPLSLMMVDVDHFKRINDQHGHPIGDEVLAFVGKTLRATVRTEDLVGRYGGDEFIVCVRGLDTEAAKKFGVRLTNILRTKPAIVQETTFHLSVSIGISSLVHPAGGADSNTRAPSMMELVTRADAALYQAKRQGRDRVALWTPG